MLHETLKHVAPLCDALESNILDGDDATVQEQASELIVWTQTLQSLFDLEPSNPRKALEAIDQSIASLTQVYIFQNRKRSTSQKPIYNGEPLNV